jgi:O-antigen/teichoic acid export membrane protein
MTQVAANDAMKPAVPPDAGYRAVFKSTAIIGGASVINIVFGLVRMKAAALLLGPAGVGLVGLYVALMATASTIAQLGIGTVGTRQIAEAHATNDADRLNVSRWALLIATAVLAVLGGAAVWALRVPLAATAIGDAGAAPGVGVVALGVSLSVAGIAQGALLQGMRRMRDMALMSILGALVTTLVTVPLLWQFGTNAITVYVVLTPLVGFLLGYWFVAKLPKTGGRAVTFNELKPQWAMLLRLGVPFMAAAVVGALVELWVRIDVRQQLGDVALGQFQASWTIAAVYVGFVLSAMGTDYYPRLTAAINDPAEARTIVNQQTEVALLLCGPVVIIMFGMAPIVVGLLYSADFAPAATMLRWQALATALKLATWPLGYILLAAGAGRAFFIVEIASVVIMASFIHVLIGRIGLQGAGIAYLASYVACLPLVYWLAVRRIAFRWTPDVIRTLVALLGCLSLIWAVVRIAPAWAAATSLACTALFGGFAFMRCSQLGMIQMLRDTLGRLRARFE